jgi:glycosyltransferase involved in cell wall biosynthesis
MRLLFVADGRSPTALNWIRHFIEIGEEVHLASTYPCQPIPGLVSLTGIPIGGSELTADTPESLRRGLQSGLRRLLPVGIRTALRRWLGARTLDRAALRLAELARRLQPDLVHAMRIPFEGMLAAQALQDMPHIPLVVSIWGNDFTLHAPSSPRLGMLTRATLKRAGGLHPDCQRDARLAQEWGYDRQKPVLVAPGNGGIHLDVFYPSPEDAADQPATVVNPRGIRSYVRNDVFFHSIPLVLDRFPEVRFECPAMAGEARAESWVKSLHLESQVRLLPRLDRLEMADLLRRAQVVVSPSIHDGTPNTLLEAMACGCFPVAGDIESLHEWIRSGENGLLVDPTSPQALAQGIVHALQDAPLREQARPINSRMIRERAEHGQVMAQAEAFYLRIVG